MPADSASSTESILDVLIVGAGLSGIGAAVHLQQRCPTKRYAILEARSAIGGTWDLLRYPGIRSDSDMYTLGYRFKPWTDPKAIADGASILRYVRETADEGGITPHIRFHQKVVSAAWSSRDACWSVDGTPLRASEALTYKGMMLSDVPNLALAFGYTNASWTLKADLTAAYVCRLLRYMDRHGKAIAVPRRQDGQQPQPFLSFSSGYVERARDILPKQGSRAPWQVHQNYLKDLSVIRFGRLEDGVMRFGLPGAMP